MRSMVMPVATFGLLLVLAGCGGAAGANQQDTYPVTGTLTFHNAPLADASITYVPLKEGMPPAVGRTDSSGNYMLTTYNINDGAVEGDYKVLIVKIAQAASDDDDDMGEHSDDPNAEFDDTSHDAAKAKKSSGSLIPSRYSAKEATPFSATVAADGENKFDFDLQ